MAAGGGGEDVERCVGVVTIFRSSPSPFESFASQPFFHYFKIWKTVKMSGTRIFGSQCGTLFLGLLILVSNVKGEEELFSRASCNFAINILKSQIKSSENNAVLSPSSIGTLLSILQQGAKENTLAQLDKVLEMTAEQSKLGQSFVLKSLQREKLNVTLEWGNKAYIRPGFELADSFNTTIKENYGAVIEEINFVEPSPQEAANTINNWIKEVTHDNIKELIPSSVLSADTVLLLLNAVYFKGLWDVPFKVLLTKDDSFETSPNNSIQVPFMSQKERFVAGEDPELGVQWVDLPFKDEQFSMLFILPIEKHGLSQVLEKFSGSSLKKIIEDQDTRQVTISLPKFKLNQKVLLSKALEELGLTEIFTPDSNLEGITPNFKNLKVSKIIHQASLEIDESGSTAAAATGIIFEVLSSIKTSDHLVFRADHPFLFFLLDRKNKIPLFAGKVADPR